MTRKFIISVFAFALLALSFSSCDKTPKQDKNVGVAQYAPDVYWADNYKGKLGIQMGKSRSGAARMMLGGVQLYVTGLNVYNLFPQSWERDNMGTKRIDQTIAVLAENEVPIVRFSCAPFYGGDGEDNPLGVNQWKLYYENQKELYFANLEHLAQKCDENHILLIPSFFWAIGSVPMYLTSKDPSDPQDHNDLGKEGTRSSDFIKTYTKEVIDVLKDHKCIAGWEFGNEFNLSVDIPGGGSGWTGNNLAKAAKIFADVCMANDPYQRLVMSGYSKMRNSQFNQYSLGTWTTDTYDEYCKINKILYPDPMNGISEHIYGEDRVFADLGTGNLNLTQTVIRLKDMAASLGKVCYVGEFLGPVTSKGDYAAVEKFYKCFAAQRVQLSLNWCYSLEATIEYSYKAGTKDGDFIFDTIRQTNARLAKIKQD